MGWSDNDAEDTNIYKVVINQEEQYSIWPTHRENPLGWNDVGKTGLKAECLAYIKEVWTDMRPLSLRKAMEEAAKNPPPPPPPPSDKPQEDDLVTRLTEGDHPVEASLRPEKSIKNFKEAVDRGYVLIKFTGTQGGTELGIRLDPETSDVSQIGLEDPTGTVHLEGDLVLNFVKVRCIADIDLESLNGKGHLVRLEA